MGFPGISDGKASASNAGDLGLIPGSGRSSGEGEWLPTPVFLGFPCGSVSKESACNVVDLGWEDPPPGFWSGEFYGWGCLVAYSSWGSKELVMTE